MVLKTKNADVPAFESDDDTVAAAPAARVPDNEAPSPTDTAKVAASTAIAKAGAGAVMAKPIKATAAFAEYEGALPEVEFGTFPRITVDLGGFEMEKEVLGETIKLEMMSWAHRYVVTPGSDDKEANERVKYSNDGVTLSDGSGVTVLDYLNTLKNVHGYDNASKKAYIDLTGLLVTKGDKAVPEDEQVIVQVQLSPQSVKQFNGYRITKGVLEARTGSATGNILTMTKERGEYNSNKFAFVKFR